MRTGAMEKQPTRDENVATSESPWNAQLNPVPWEADLLIPQAPQSSASPPSPVRDDQFKQMPLAPPPSRGAGAPVFTAELGPALWEQDALGTGTTRGPATAAPRIGTGIGVGGPRMGTATRVGTGVGARG